MFTHSLMEVFAAFDCYLNIKSSSFILKAKNAPLFIILCSHIFPFIYYIYIPFNYKIVFSNVNNKTYFEQIFTEFYYTAYSKIFRLTNIFLRDILTVICLFIINCLIWNIIRKTLKQKTRLINPNKFEQKVILSSAKRAELKSRVLIVFSSLIYLIGRANPVTNNIFGLTVQFSIYSECIWSYGNIIFFLSYTLNIFVLYNFNNCFKRELLFILLNIKNLFKSPKIPTVIKSTEEQTYIEHSNPKS